MTTATELVLTAAANVTAATGTKPARISIDPAYGGGVMVVAPFGPVALDLSGLTLPSTLPLLVDHNNTIEGVAGHGVASIKGGRLVVVGELVRDSQAGEAVLRLHAGGVSLAASVGLEIITSRRLKVGESTTINNRTVTAPSPGGLLVILSGRLREISLLPIGADAETSIRIAASAAGKRAHMETTQEELLAAESARLELIGDAAGKYPTLAAKAASEGWDTRRLTAEIKIADVQAARPRGPAIWGTGQDTAPARDVLAAACLTVFGANAEKLCGAQAAEQARALRCTSLMDVVKASLSMTDSGIPRGGPSAILSAGFSSIDLAHALGDSIGKMALDSYLSAPATWRSHAKVLDVPDFHPTKAIRPSFSGALQKVAPGGEVQYGIVTEDVALIRAYTFAQLLVLDRQDLINDDAGIFSQTVGALGRNAARSVSDVYYETLLANVGDFFGEDHGNLLTGGGSELSFTALAAAITLMRSRRDASGRDLDIVPRVLLVPPTLETLGRQLLASASVARYTADGIDNQPQGNPFTNMVLEVESRLSNPTFAGSSDAAWYLLASPQDACTAVAFLHGNQSPVTETFTPSDTPSVLAFQYRTYLDHGAALVDHRAGVKSDGE